MAKAEEKEAFTLSATQLVERSKNREIVTGTISSDMAFGGGIPFGCTVLIGGKAKSGKTTTVLQYAANAQKKFGAEVIYCNVEGRLDYKTLSQVKNLDLDKMQIIMGPPIYDKEKNIIGHRKMSSQEWWTKIGSLIANKPKSVIIVDSVSALCEEAEMTTGMGHQSRGGLQKLEAQFQRQYGDLIMPSGIILFLLAHIQANTSGYGESTLIKCGNAIRFMADTIVFIKSAEKWKPTPTGRILGHDMVWKVEHPPLSAPKFEKTMVPLRYGKGLDCIGDVVTQAINFDMIKANSSWYILPFTDQQGKIEYFVVPENKEEQGKNIKIQGEESVHEFFTQHPDALDLLEQNVRKTIF